MRISDLIISLNAVLNDILVVFIDILDILNIRGAHTQDQLD